MAAKLKRKAPSENGSELTPEQVRTYLGNSNIPLRAASLTSAHIPLDLKNYLASSAFAQDHAKGVGLNIYGNPTKRSDAMMVLAKMLTLQGRSTYFVTLHQLLSIIEGGGEKLHIVRRTKNLFIDWFERKFPKANERPYSYYQLISVEEFLQQRMYVGNVTNFGSTCAWNMHTWWSEDFLASFCDNVINMRADK